MMMPHRVALALQADGWVVRQDCVWEKPNPMPESVRGWTWTRHRVRIRHHAHLSNMQAGNSNSEDGSADLPLMSGHTQIAEATRVPADRSREDGESQIHEEREREGGGAEIQSIGQGEGHTKSSSGAALRRKPNESSRILAETQQAPVEQERPEEVRENSQRQSPNIGDTAALQGIAEGFGIRRPRRSTTAQETISDGLQLDRLRMGGDQNGPRPQMLLLRPQDGTADDGSRDPAGQERQAHERERSTGMSELQQSEGDEALASVLVDCPGCDECLPNGGYVLRKGSFRHTRAHEYVFMLTKQMQYWSDQEAVRELADGDTHDRGTKLDPPMEHAGIGHIGWTRGTAERVSHRNPRSVLHIPTAPYSGFTAHGDYVGDDGKPYKASSDCPIHGHLVSRRKSYKGVGDARQAVLPSRNLGIETDPGVAPLPSQDAMISHTIEAERDETSPPRKSENNPESKSEGDRLAPISVERTAENTNRMSVDDVPMPDSLDLQAREYSHVAIQHNKPSRKKVLVQSSEQVNTSSVQTTSHTDDIQVADAPDDLVEHRPVSNTSTDLFEGQAASRIEHKSSRTHYKCTCRISRADHYATFPPALIAPLILATCPRWCCPVCGQGWAPVVENHWKDAGRKHDDGYASAKQRGYLRLERDDNDGFATRVPPGTVNADITVLGHRPTCAHPHTQAEAVPGIVFDPFVGSGTSVMVAKQLLRRGIGFDISRPYLIEQAKARIRVSLAPKGKRAKPTTEPRLF